MKIKLNNVSKIFIILSLVIVVAGMALLGFLGLNQTVDYSDGYEMTVYAKNVLEDDAVAMKEATDEYLAQKGLSSNQFTTQVLPSNRSDARKIPAAYRIRAFCALAL